MTIMLGGARRAVMGTALAAVLVVAAGRARPGGEETDVKGLHDVTTDLLNPPAFVDVLPHRQWALNPPEYDGAEAAALQRQAYPDLQPLDLALPPATVHAALRSLIDERGWEVVGDDEAAGRIEAISVTPWLRFRDDVVVRLTAIPTGTRVDVRSKSRLGSGDFGANAKRVRRLLDDLAVTLAESASQP